MTNLQKINIINLLIHTASSIISTCNKAEDHAVAGYTLKHSSMHAITTIRTIAFIHASGEKMLDSLGDLKILAFQSRYGSMWKYQQ